MQNSGGGSSSSEMRKRERMRRWLCCTRQRKEDSYQTSDNLYIKCAANNADGNFFLLLMTSPD